MYYLLYASTAVERMNDEQLESILEVSRCNNAAVNVSGMLLYDDGSFIQFIEGEKSDVIDLFERIAEDSRHFGVFVLDQGEADQRCLPDWKMGYSRLSKDTSYAYSSGRGQRRQPNAGNGNPEKAGHDVEVAVNGVEAVKAVQEDTFDAVLMDI